MVIANPAALTLDNGAIGIRQAGQSARVMLEDINVLILDHPQISLTAPLLAACAEACVAVLTVDAAHLPNGVLLSYLPHSRALKVMTAQLAIGLPTRKCLWRHIVKMKIMNQAAILKIVGRDESGQRLFKLARTLRSGDPDNHEAQAAQVYFRHIFHANFNRGQSCFYNAALNYGYAVIRAAIARSLTSYGFLPAFGIFHHNEQNAFNLADDLIEPYRPFVDAVVLHHYPDEPERELAPADKARLVKVLHQDIRISSHRAEEGRCTLMAAVDATVSSLSGIVLNGTRIESLVLPLFDVSVHDDL
ncbi:type II CRISPR-associated endonuclease Cas1 [Paraburkholderia hayleyella]|uniref:type II CRISPR-associated endonuclease Cas1 n=1 Tax=Paraburkholderia hayleyella TaxID=2152889 RepID=UPI001580B559|nr:type II CRISPR-associated endonuclease Cas1 [Paraburkholderia hayleyella]